MPNPAPQKGSENKAKGMLAGKGTESAPIVQKRINEFQAIANKPVNTIDGSKPAGGTIISRESAFFVNRILLPSPKHPIQQLYHLAEAGIAE